MDKKLTLIVFIINLGISGGYQIDNCSKITKQENLNMKPNPQEISTKFLSPETIVLQVFAGSKIGKTTVNGKHAYGNAAFVFMPNGSGASISCPLNYFQQKASLKQKWILNDSGEKIEINGAHNFKKIIVTIKADGMEAVIKLPSGYPKRLFDYFMLDISHNENVYRGFDCYAFASSIANVKYCPLNPDFDYKAGTPSIGDVIVLSNGRNLPESIKHWAIFLGDNQYLSKFGRAGEGASSLVTVMDLEGMKLLYDANLTFIATPKANAKSWQGYGP